MSRRTGPGLGAITFLSGLMLLSACAHQSTPGLSLLSLPPSPDDLGASTVMTIEPQWVVARVDIPEYLQSNRVRYRDGAATLAEWPDARWAERLEIGLTRQLTQALSKHRAVCAAPCDVSAPTTPTLHVRFDALDARRDIGQVQASVVWWLSSPRQTTPIRLTRLTVTEPLPDGTAQAYASALTRLTTQLAGQISTALQP